MSVNESIPRATEVTCEVSISPFAHANESIAPVIESKTSVSHLTCFQLATEGLQRNSQANVMKTNHQAKSI